MQEEERINIFLDDIRHPKDAVSYTGDNKYWNLQWGVPRNYEQFVNLVTLIISDGNKIDLISFDHDLAPEHYAPSDRYNDYENWLAETGTVEKTGYDCAKWLLEFYQERNLELPEIKCHSMNVIGKQNILNLFSDYARGTLGNR